VWAQATVSTTTSGTWTNASELICLVYRGTKRVGANVGGGGLNTIIEFPALALNRTDGSSWVVGVVGHRSANNVDVAPNNMTNRAFTGTEAAGHDTNGGVSSWSRQTVTPSSNNSWRSWVVELRDDSLIRTPLVGAFTLSGNSVTLTVAGGANNYSLAADTGNFTGSYSSANLVLSQILFANIGALVLGSSDTGLRQSHRLTADTRTYTFTYNAANLTFTPVSAGYSLAAAPATFTLTAPTVLLTKGWRLDATTRSFIVLRVSAGLKRTYALTAASRAFIFNFRTADLIYSGLQLIFKKFYYQSITDDPRSLDVGGSAPGAGLVYYINKYFRIL
jgi:hypothetical protein